MGKSYNNKATGSAVSGSGSELVAAGLDAALVDGLKKGDLAAVSAAAEIVGNAMVQELMGLSASLQDGVSDLGDATEQVAKTADPKRVVQEDWQDDQLESREGGRRWRGCRGFR